MGTSHEVSLLGTGGQGGGSLSSLPAVMLMVDAPNWQKVPSTLRGQAQLIPVQ